MLDYITPYKNKTVMVTGCAGFIGSHLTEALLNAGAQVVGVDNFYNGLEENIAPFLSNTNFKFFRADVRDGTFLIENMKGVDIVFHEGAYISVQQSILMPQFCNDVNVGGTINVLNAARINEVQHVVFASSAAIYGDDPELPKQERQYPAPLTPYGVSKLAGESYLITYHYTYGMNTTALRYFNVYGPRSRNNSYAGVMALFIEGILRTGQEPIIYGDGSQTRDFVYVKDVVKANMLAAIADNSAGEVFNVAGGNPIDINNLTQLILKYTNREDMTIHYEEARHGDILHSQANISKIQTMLGFEPDYTIEQGLDEYIAFMKSKINSEEI